MPVARAGFSVLVINPDCHRGRPICSVGPFTSESALSTSGGSMEMYTEDRAGKKKHRWTRDSAAEEHDDHPKKAKAKVEVMHLRRVMKRGKMAVRHMSEALERDKVTE